MRSAKPTKHELARSRYAETVKTMTLQERAEHMGKPAKPNEETEASHPTMKAAIAEDAKQ